jgi:signal transduction histidine kinase
MRNKTVAHGHPWQLGWAVNWLSSLCHAPIALFRRGLVRTSKTHCRNFVLLNAEAVWCVELKSSMPPGLPMDHQVAWLRDRAYIAECNPAYRRLGQRYGLSDAESQRWRVDFPWSAVYIKHFEEAAQQRYSLTGVEFSMVVDGEPVTYATTFTAVMEGERLARIWGMACDVTGLAQRSDRLERERLRQYALKLGQAEERARRTVAVDLHDGIGQLLTGLQLNLSAARSCDAGTATRLLAESEATVAQIQAMTYDMVTDLSPPGLYDFGLTVALEWLASRLAKRNGVQLELTVSGVPDHALDIEWRVFVFKIVRELVQNAARHAEVKTVRVGVVVEQVRLNISVADRGVGFSMVPSVGSANGHGFGLWSIADRVRAAGGRFHIDSAPGQGCLVTVSVPMPAGSST